MSSVENGMMKFVIANSQIYHFVAPSVYEYEYIVSH